MSPIRSFNVVLTLLSLNPLFILVSTYVLVSTLEIGTSLAVTIYHFIVLYNGMNFNVTAMYLPIYMFELKKLYSVFANY